MVEISSSRIRNQCRRTELREEDEENKEDSTASRAVNIVSSYESQSMPFHVTSTRPCCIKCLDYAKGIVAIGDVRGSLHIVHLPPPQPPFTSNNNFEKFENSEDSEDEELEVDAFIAPPTQQYPITCFEYHRPSARLFCLWDRGECGAWRPYENGVVRIFDVENQQLETSLTEILDYYELCTILCPSATTDSTHFEADTISSSNSGGNEVIAGTVKLSQDRWADGMCPRCHPTVPASLCWHQHRSSNAALAFFDLRAGESPGRMVNR
jgi:hypothetical protein